MHDHRIWSIGIFRWGPVRVRLHLFFVLFAAFTLYLGSLEDQGKPGSGHLALAGASVLILLAGVLAHELGHYFASRFYGGRMDWLILGPFGGLAPPHVVGDARGQLVATLAGPAVNLTLACCCLIAETVVLGQVPSEWLARLNPLSPQHLADSAGTVHALSLMSLLQLTFWTHWVLFLVNMIPAFPFDGGRAMQTILTSAPTKHGTRHAMFLVTGTAKVCALLLLISALFQMARTNESPTIIPVWFALTLLAMFLYFGARVEEEQFVISDAETNPLGYDFSQGYTSLEWSETAATATKANPLTRWLEENRRQREQRQQAEEEAEDLRVDDILARLHEVGMENLPPDERALLQRVSARYRSRERS